MNIHNVTINKDIKIKMRDGVNLYTDIYFPSDENHKPIYDLPILLERTPYDKKALNLTQRYNHFCQNGYIVIGIPPELNPNINQNLYKKDDGNAPIYSQFSIIGIKLVKPSSIFTQISQKNRLAKNSSPPMPIIDPSHPSPSANMFSCIG